tara:strand:+ start:2957 stop:3463 length:507 start_codon:yes stop_codon:yes gene_type:complete
MTSLQVAEKKEKSLAEILVVVVLVALLMASFIFYFFKNQGQLTRAGFESITQVFSARVNGIRAQWFMDKQPDFVNVESSNRQADGGSVVNIPVNNQGWVDAGSSALVCQKIWHYVMESSLTYMKEPIGSVLIDPKNHKMNYCQYSLSSGEYFTYYRHSGKVSAVKLTY